MNSAPRRLSAARVDWRAVLEQLRAEIGSQPAWPTASPSPRSAGSGRSIRARAPALVQLNAVTSQILHRHRAQPGAGAAAVRHRGLSRRPRPSGAPDEPVAGALSGRTSGPSICSMPGRPATTRCSRSSPARRRWPAAADLRQAGRSADHRLDPDLRHRRSARRQGRTGQGAGGAISRPAPLHPRRLCALRLHPLRRGLCGVDPVPRLGAARRGGWPAARPTRSPSAS